MEWTGLNELREQFLSFYVGKGHYRMESFPLIPQDDKSLLLINSGMAPLKKYFLGQAKVPGNRATTCQKCIRTPDIERVGKTARHGTYFEMLGNFSFGDYFKREAIHWAWEFITTVIKMPVDRLYISVFEDDDEAYGIWTKEIGVEPSHMVRLGRDDNFWEIGSGPCGPCSEIYFDRGEKYGCGKPTCGVGCDCDRYVEFWNLVFTQFISDGNGHYEKMEHGNIDTGMGLERLACICQGVDNLFEVDTVQNIMKHIERIAGVEYHKDDKTDVSLRVITDHIRSTVFMVGDGVGPSNEGRGYVLRRLLRRAARHGRLLGVERPFLYEVCDTVIDENKSAYPNLDEHRDYIKKVIKAEEERFAKTVDAGFESLNSLLDEMEKKGETVLSGSEAFRLSDTLGFPLDLTKEIIAERGCTVDEDAFNALLSAQKKRARDDAKSRDYSWETDLFKDLGCKPTEFIGYDTMESAAKLLFIAKDGGAVDAAAEGDEVKLILDRTPFYAESGGQVGDRGAIEAGKCVVAVSDCRKTNEGYYVHTGVVKTGVLEAGAAVQAKVDKKLRAATMRNHTSAHLLQAALREVLGEHVHQAGSYVDEHRVRFDFTHFEAVKPEELRRVEEIVNDTILAGIEVNHKVMPIAEAKKLGAMALFGEKYGDIVRVIEVPGVSTEFCGGTHVRNTASLGLFKILSEASVAAGVRRIEGTTGRGVLDYIRADDALLAETAAVFRLTGKEELPAKAKAALAQTKELERALEAANAKLAGSAADAILKSAEDVGCVRVFTGTLAGASADALRDTAAMLRDKYPLSVAVLASAGDKLTLCAAVGADAQKKGLRAGDIVKAAAAAVGGSGGGKPDLAMAGGRDAAKLPEAFAAAKAAVAANIR
ncbi:MAG: alanine--tRNA ligase [Oscillospiraceae bacterium]|nr:alanine--tRNA ligase [Oscillospiraceae bacterium]